LNAKTLNIVTSRLFRVTFCHRWRHQSTRYRHFSIESVLDTNL